MAKNRINYGSQFIDKDDIQSVIKSLKSKNITNGTFVKKFQKNLEKYLNVKHVSVCNSGTSALELAMIAIGLKSNDNIILPSINFVASANIVKRFNANIFFCDIDENTGQINHELVQRCVEKNNLKKIKAIIAMYNGGYPRDISNLAKLKKKYKCLIIEDACHAFGAEYFYKNKKFKIGSCYHADISVFSFHPLKTITTAEGGAVATNLSIFYRKVELFKSHGIVRKKFHWKYDVIKSGFNYRLSDINCALGLSQLKKIKFILTKRKEIYKKYLNQLDNYRNALTIIKPENKTQPSYHLVFLKISTNKLKINKEEILKILLRNNICCQVHYIPLYKFTNFYSKTSLKGAEKYYSTVFSLPIHVNLNNISINKILRKIKEIIDTNIKKKK